MGPAGKLRSMKLAHSHPSAQAEAAWSEQEL